ncbi:hypothetical protein GWK47_050302 [Chionoecetes opilio]|uniref:Uncharacterized protein n=1 Tax=Chionoecetes opilio TaxID=41210 RepID=A0A8J5CSY5_CHIOP|nr:hypothetical protein GWK47_050302 [Chionoecetes opilio]
MTVSYSGTDLDDIMCRAESLGDHSELHRSLSRPKLSKKPVRYGNIVKSEFEDNLRQCVLPVNCDVNVMADSVTEVLYECVRKSENHVCHNIYSDNNLDRWERLLQDRDDSRVWRAIDWKGNVNVSGSVGESRPSDEEFKTHFETVLNPTQAATNYPDIDTNLSIPILDDPITPQEVELQIRKMKPDKACGPDV